MIVRRLAARRLVKSGSTEEEPRRKRAARFLFAIIVAGTLSGIAAWLGIWPFGNVQALLRNTFSSGVVQLSAQSVFPPVQPTHKTVDVYDPAPARHADPPASPRAAPTARPASSPRTSPPPDE